MTHYESRINLNNEWRTLLIVETDAEQTFGTSLSFTADNVTTIYRVGNPLEHFVSADGHKYWFIPSVKQLIIHEKDSELHDIINVMLGEDNYEE